MNIHEYQAKELFASNGIPVPRQILVRTPEEARAAAAELGFPCVIKAQVHAGGRGKAGGVKLVRDAEGAFSAASEMLSKPLITKQSGPAGIRVDQLLVCEGVSIEQEYYISLTMDPARMSPVLLLSRSGGMDIEELTENDPDAIRKIPILPAIGFKPYHGIEAAKVLGLSGKSAQELTDILSALCQMFRDLDCSLIEINPLVLTTDHHLNAIDAKITFDDNALFRHPEITALRDLSQEDPREAEAKSRGFSFISLHGNIGCLVNGAGLAMATMDLIQSMGGAPANFLDVGGSASAEKVAGAFRLILQDTSVRAILVNIFGGIMKCDIIADGIVTAAKEVGIHVPLIVRLEGTNAAAGKEILAGSGLAITAADGFHDAVEKAVAAAGI